MKIAYISRINLLSGRTNVYNLAKTCEALNTQKDFSVQLVTTDQKRDTGAFFQKMGVHVQFEITCLGVTNTASDFGGKKWYEAGVFALANLRLIFFLIRNFRIFDAIYFRDESLFLTTLFVRLFTCKKIFFEIHSVYERRFRQLKNDLAVRSAHGVVAISSGLRRYYAPLNTHILVSLCSAAEDSWFAGLPDTQTLRRELGLPLDAFIVGYTGVVGINPNNDFYEVDDVVRSLAELPSNVVCVIVGEIGNNAEWLRTVAAEAEVSERVMFVPWQERNMIPKYLRAFDVNVIPKRKKDLVGDSPAKMFPALAARVPIIAGRAESIQEVLTDGVDSLIVTENNPAGWAKAIQNIMQDHALAQKISAGAFVTKGKYTWERRGETIARFLSETSAL